MGSHSSHDNVLAMKLEYEKKRVATYRGNVRVVLDMFRPSLTTKIKGEVVDVRRVQMASVEILDQLGESLQTVRVHAFNDDVTEKLEAFIESLLRAIDDGNPDFKREDPPRRQRASTVAGQDLRGAVK